MGIRYINEACAICHRAYHGSDNKLCPVCQTDPEIALARRRAFMARRLLIELALIALIALVCALNYRSRLPLE